MEAVNIGQDNLLFFFPSASTRCDTFFFSPEGVLFGVVFFPFKLRTHFFLTCHGPSSLEVLNHDCQESTYLVTTSFSIRAIQPSTTHTKKPQMPCLSFWPQAAPCPSVLVSSHIKWRRHIAGEFRRWMN